jgi:ATPase subunit of ABC transporter with duplicated ATPase domains
VAITHDRYFLDNAAEWILNWTVAMVSEGQLQHLAGTKANAWRSLKGEEARRASVQRNWSGHARTLPHVRPRASHAWPVLRTERL